MNLILQELKVQENFQPSVLVQYRKKHKKNIEERDGLIRKFLKGWTSCCFPPNILWRNPFHWNFKGLDRIQSFVLKGHAEKFPEMMESFQNPMLFPPFQMGPKK
jgi:hypothetical protein